MPPGIDPGVGDWRCPNADCGNWNWAKRDECNKCYAKHPGRRVDAGRKYRGVEGKAALLQDRRCGLDTGKGFIGGGEGGQRGDGIREERDRKRRRDEEREQIEQRKATKQKCEYCKRASCIC